MATRSRSAMFRNLALLQQHQDDMPECAVELIFTSAGQDTGKHGAEEALFRMAMEIKILRLKQKIGCFR